MKTTKTPFSGYEKWVVLLLALTQFTVILDFMIMSPLGDTIMKTLKLTPRQFGLCVSAYAFSAGISGLLTAGFADKFDRKKLLLFFYSGFIIGTFFCAWSHTYIQLLAARTVTGLFGGVIGSVSMAIVTDLFSLQQRGRVMGFVQMGFGASQVLGLPIGLAMANRWGWDSPFLLAAIIAVLVFVGILFKMLPVNGHLQVGQKKSPLRHLLHTFAERRYRIGFLATSLMSVGGFMMMPFGSAFAINNLHVTTGQLPIIYTVSGVASLIFMPLVGRFSDKINKLRLFSLSTLWFIVIIVIYTNLSTTPLWIVLILNVLMMMGIMSRMIPSTALISALPEMTDRGAFMSINASLQQIAGGIAAALGGMVVVQKTKTSPLEHYNWVGYIAVALSLLNIYMLSRVNKSVAHKSVVAEVCHPRK
ncbi:MAG: MFS transporter [Chitinophagaceae bacterium]